MFYRLTRIDDLALPQPVVIHGHSYQVMRGDLLLEPPGAIDVPLLDGHSILKFFGTWPSGEEGFIASSSEPYRSSSTNQIDISRRESDLGARFSGTADERSARLTMMSGTRFLPSGTVLAFVAAPDEPIGDDWKDTFDFGPFYAQIEDPAVQNAFREWAAAQEPERLANARSRIERAWRAPPA
jgi:hypothetical protein